MLDPSIADFIRDTLSAVVAGVALVGIGAYRAHRRNVRERLQRHAIEIRHTQKETEVEPVFPEYPGDKL